MMKQDNISNELKSLNSSLPEGLPTPYSVPEGYFEGLAASVLAKVRNNQIPAEEVKEISPLLAGISKEMPYSVPENYFEENLNNIPALVQAEVESPVLQVIGKEMPYQVPVGYFASLENEVLQKLPKKQAKVIPLSGRKWVKMAVAAVVTGIIAFAGFNYLNSDESLGAGYTARKADTVNTQTAALPKKEAEAVVAELKQVSATELEAFIKNVDIPRRPETVSANGTAKKEIKEALKNVPVSEIESFLNEIPTADEELLITD